MSNLSDLSQRRAELPEFGGPADPLPHKLALGQEEARRRLARYVGDFRYDADQADAVLHRVASWAERERVRLEAVLADPTSIDLPRAIQLDLGVEQARQFVVASYSAATRTLGPWLSGDVARRLYGGEVTEPAMRDDAAARLAIFGSIVRWDEDGDLALLWQPEALSGLAPVIQGVIIIAVAIVLVAGAAVLLNWVTSTEVVRRNAALFERWCEEARARGDTATMRLCIEKSADLQKEREPNILVEGLKYAALVGGVYVALVHGVPVVVKALSKRGPARA